MMTGKKPKRFKNRPLVLQECLEDVEGGQTFEAVADMYPRYEDVRRGLIGAQWLTGHSQAFNPNAEFLSASHGRLLARIHKQPAGGRLVRLQGWISGFSLPYRSRQLAVQAVMALMLLLTLSISSERVWRASYAWLPGDLTYPLKMLVEGTRLAVHPSAAANAQLHIEYARQRLIEVQCLIFEGRFEFIASTVNGFERHVARALGALSKVAQRDPLQAKLLANALEDTFAMHTRLVLMLSGAAPMQYQAQFDKVRLVSEASASALKETLSPGGDRPAGFLLVQGGAVRGTYTRIIEFQAWLSPYSFVGKAQFM